MKNILLILILFFTTEIVAQNRKTVFYDSTGQLTTFEEHWAQVITGRYKSNYIKSENKRILVKMTSGEFQAELDKTEKRITTANKLGTNFPEFSVYNLDGNHLAKSSLFGKVIVVNFWFIGCAPCEMERPALNDLVKHYQANSDVVFISFARNEKERLLNFLAGHPVLYHVVPTEKDFIKAQFEVNAYPTNVIIDRAGNYFFNSSASGVGIQSIMQKYIDKALEK
jgi:thiol-disulfide isomerase/thioredoxin